MQEVGGQVNKTNVVMLVCIFRFKTLKANSDSDTHRTVAVQDQGLDQLVAVGLRRGCSTQGGESQQSNNQLCGHGWRAAGSLGTTLVSGTPPGSESSKAQVGGAVV